MKKWATLSLLLLMLPAFGACGSSQEPPTASSKEPTAEEQAGEIREQAEAYHQAAIFLHDDAEAVAQAMQAGTAPKKALQALNLWGLIEAGIAKDALPAAKDVTHSVSPFEGQGPLPPGFTWSDPLTKDWCYVGEYRSQLLVHLSNRWLWDNGWTPRYGTPDDYAHFTDDGKPRKSVPFDAKTKKALSAYINSIDN